MTKLVETKDDIKNAVNDFYHALNEIFKGNSSDMFSLWSHAEDVTYLGPLGEILVGWEKVSNAWEAQASAKLGGQVHPDDMHIFHYGNLFIVQNFEIGENVVSGERKLVKIRASTAFRHEEGR